MSTTGSRGLVRSPAWQRRTLLAAVLALMLAPVVANLWPALGRGPMLYTGDVAGATGGMLAAPHQPHAGMEAARASHPADHRQPVSVHLHHHAAGDAFAREDAAAAGAEDLASAGTAAGDAAGHREADAAAADAHAGHALHCALCVLASLGWAPQGQILHNLGGVAPRSRAAPPPVSAPHAFDARASVQARAPPARS